jgi:hypothetical protein
VYPSGDALLRNLIIGIAAAALAPRSAKKLKTPARRRRRSVSLDAAKAISNPPATKSQLLIQSSRPGGNGTVGFLVIRAARLQDSRVRGRPHLISFNAALARS